MEKKSLFPATGGFLHGGDYNPEQWLDRPDILKEDIKMMKKAGINSATLGVFSWSVYEPSEGEYNFGWLTDVMDNLYEMVFILCLLHLPGHVLHGLMRSIQKLCVLIIMDTGTIMVSGITIV